MKTQNVEMKIPVIFFKEDGVSIVYCPLLDISGYGNTVSEAKKSFQIAMSEYFEYAKKKLNNQKSSLRRS